MQFDYLAALLVVGIVSLFVRPTWKIGAALLATWLLCTGAYYATGVYDLWQWNAFVNLAATVFIMRHPANKVGSVIGGTLLVQALIDLSYGVANNHAMMVQYLDIQTGIAWLQLAVVSSWHVGGVCHLVRRRHSQARASHRSSVAGW